MKVRNPKHRYDLHIKKNDYVLEVGGGHNPHPRSNVVVDKYAGNKNLHRGLDLKVFAYQKFLEIDGEDLPFKDKEFNYVICNHVLEHVDDPHQFLSQQSRVATRGYIETPSLIGEYLVPKASHKWVILEIDNKIVLYEKELLKFSSGIDFGYIFNEYLPKHSIAFKLLQRTQPNLITVNYEWKDEIEFVINPKDSYYLDYFTQPWDEKFCENLLIQRSLGQEAKATFQSFIDICRSVFKSKIIKK